MVMIIWKVVFKGIDPKISKPTSNKCLPYWYVTIQPSNYILNSCTPLYFMCVIVFLVSYTLLPASSAYLTGHRAHKDQFTSSFAFNRSHSLTIDNTIYHFWYLQDFYKSQDIPLQPFSFFYRIFKKFLEKLFHSIVC